MSTTVKNISLYLTPKQGLNSDYKLILTIYNADHSQCGTPTGIALAVSERPVDDIDHEGWFSFKFDPPVFLNTGYYCMVLNQISNNINDMVDFTSNFVDWVHSEDISTPHGLYGFSTDSKFRTEYGYNFTKTGIAIYGYGYGYDDEYYPTYDFFNIFGVSGSDTGYSYDDNLTQDYGYGYGYEFTDFYFSNAIFRNFRVYDDFNNIEIIDGENKVCINVPPAIEDVFTIQNRQDFLDGQKSEVEVVGNSLTLKNGGERFYFFDTSSLKSECTFSGDIAHKANLFLSNNTINYFDVSNPTGNTNPYDVYLVSAPYSSGIYVSSDGGSSWTEKNSGLTLADNNERNFSCVKFGPEASYILAFDNTNISERGTVYKSTDNGDSWTEINGDSAGDGALLGKKINDAYVVSFSSIWVGTDDDGVYSTSDGGLTWVSKNFNLPPGAQINHINSYSNLSPEYGYGYGYGSGLNFFDVFGIEGDEFGYGISDFESTFADKYGYGYGWEYGISSTVDPIIYIATDSGVYRLINSSWEQIYDEESFSVALSQSSIYIGKSNGMIRSIDGGISFQGSIDTVGGVPLLDDFYPNGLLKKKITRIATNPLSDDDVYLTQYGGVFWSRNEGGNFQILSTDLAEKKFNMIVLNPLNGNFAYASSESTKFENAGITILMDCSGSMLSNDPTNKRIDMAKKILTTINDSATTDSYFQVLSFNLSENDYIDTKTNVRNLNGYFPGVVNRTSGFTSTLLTALDALDECKTIGEHHRTPLIDAVDVMANGINQDGSTWSYNKSSANYIYTNFTSDFFRNLDKSIIIITDGQDSVFGKNISTIISSDSIYSRLGINTYIIGIGNNINYENLLSLKNANNKTNIYLAPYSENIYSSESGDDPDNNIFNINSDSVYDVADIILERERYRTRTGIWTKIIDVGEFRKSKSIFVKSNIPTDTGCTYQIRSSSDKNTWSSWVTGLSSNIENSLSLFGRYYEIKIILTSNRAAYSPEIRQILLTTYDPSESFVMFATQSLEESEKLSQIHLSSIDDVYLSNIDDNLIDLKFGITQSKSSYFDFFDTINRDLRSVIIKRDEEDLITTDYYLYMAKNGAWPLTVPITIYDADEFINNSSTSISEDKYMSIPHLGVIIFYDRIASNKRLKMRLEYPSEYRIGINIKNRDSSSSEVCFHDISWMLHKDEDTKSSRSALAKAPSQLGTGDVFGFLTPSNHIAGDSLSTKINLQYIVPEKISAGVISLANGSIVNLRVDEDEDIETFYSNNAYFAKYQKDTSSGSSYVKIADPFTQPSLSISETSLDPLHYQINVSVSSVLFENDSMSLIIGDNSSGGTGLPTYLVQNNLLFESTDSSVGEIQTTFVAAQSDGIFNKKLSPPMNLIGNSASNLVIIAPTNVNVGIPFTFKIIATDSAGLIDKNFVGSITVGFSESTFGTIGSTQLNFTSSSAGVLTSNATVTSSGLVKINASINGVVGSTFSSNPILSNATNEIVWGDLNVSTVFSNGRQDIDFIVDYANNTSMIDFIGLTDDIENLTDQEWKYIKYKSNVESTGGFIIFPGFRYRTDNFHGERLIVFDSLSTAPETLLDAPLSNGTDPQVQIVNLINGLSGNSFLSIPIHTPYDESSGTKFRGRGFNYELYNFIGDYFTDSSSFDDFLNEKEVLAEIYSEHGGTENVSRFQNDNFKTTSESLYLQYALKKGKKFGFIAGSGGYASRPGFYKGDVTKRIPNPPAGTLSTKGLTAVISDSSSRSAIMNALRNRKCYATTGARIYLEFSAKTQNKTATIGEEILDLSSESGIKDDVIFTFRAISDSSSVLTDISVTVIEIGGLIEEYLIPGNEFDEGTGDSGNLTLIFPTSLLTTDGKEYCAYLRVRQRDGQVAWSSPIWINYGRNDVLI